MGTQDKPQRGAMASGTPCTSGCSQALATHWEALLLAVFETFLQKVVTWEKLPMPLLDESPIDLHQRFRGIF